MPKARGRIRYDHPAADLFLSQFFPVPAVRAAVGRLVADIVSTAQGVAPNSWVLRANRHEMFLSVGQVAVLLLNPEVAVLYTTQFPTRPAGLLRYESVIGRSVYAAVDVPSARIDLAVERLASLSASILKNLRRFVRAAATAKTLSPWKYAHSPAVVDAFATASRRVIEQPPYWGSEIEADSTPVTSKGLGRDVERMQEVERAAVDRVTKAYETAGWRVRSLEADKVGYDLECKRGKETRHLEVKGRAQSADTVIITNGEWQRARTDPKWVLAVVSFSGSRNEALREFSGKIVRSQSDIEPIAFRVTLPS